METLASQISALLLNTLSPHNDVVAASSDALDRLSPLPAFPLSLLSLASGGGGSVDQGVRIAAAAYLKNYVRRSVDGGTGVTKEFRDRLAEAVLVADANVLKLLDEAFRLIVQKEFVKENSWPELVPQLQGVIENSNLICKTSHSQWKTVNALTMVQTMTKCFQYFLNPKVPKESVPSQLDLIAKDILVPLLGTFHEFVDKVLLLQDQVQNEYEEFLLKICNCMYFAVRSYMPSALGPVLSSFCHDLFRMLDSVKLTDASVEGYLLRLKITKRSLIFFCALVTRHRRHSDKLMGSIVSCALRIAKYSNDLSKLNSRAERIISLAFDVISHVLETGPGWRIVSPHFSTLLESAIFPALTLNQKDIEEWEEDGEEYVRKNLPSDLDGSSGWAEDLFTARKSAINLLGVIAMSKGPIVASAASKRKIADKKKVNRHQSSMGELIVLPFFSKFPVPPGDHVSSSTVCSYYAVLMAYGALQEFLADRSSEYTMTLIRTRVLPVYSKSSSPYLFATANWVLGQLASCLPQELSSDIYGSLLSALTMPEIDSINFYPVRASAAGAIAELIENEYVPPDWFALLQVLVNRMDGADEIELSLLFHLVSTVLDAQQESVVLHVPDLVSRIANAILKHLPPIPEPWPQVVEKGFSALGAICQTWEASEPDEAEQNKLKNWQNGQAVLARTLSNLLQQAWLVSVKQSDEASSDTSPPPSCIDDISSLLHLIMRSVTNANEAEVLKVRELLAVWVELIADWQGWEELEDLAIFNCIQEAVNLQRRCYPTDFFLIRIQSQTSGAASCIFGGIAAFINQGIAAYPSAVWRACSCLHALLHAPLFSPEGVAIRQSVAVEFAQSAFSRFKDLRDNAVGMWKPLLLAISSCYLLYPEIIKQTLEDCEQNSFLCFASSLAQVSASSFTPGLSSVAEAKLAVITLLKLIESARSSALDSDNKILFDCLSSLMDACIRLRELMEEEEEEGEEQNDDSDGNGDDDDEDDGDSDDDEESEDEREETEEEFLERYAKAADELSEIIEEGDVEERSQELELGPFQEFDVEEATLSLLQNSLAGQALPSSLVEKIVTAFPQYASFS